MAILDGKIDLKDAGDFMRDFITMLAGVLTVSTGLAADPAADMPPRAGLCLWLDASATQSLEVHENSVSCCIISWKMSYGLEKNARPRENTF